MSDIQSAPSGLGACVAGAPEWPVVSLYTGILGLDRAAEAHGFTTVAACDTSAYCRHIIGHYLPGIPIYDNDKDVTSERLRRDGIDPSGVWAVIGGPPCQPSSAAGKRLGTSDSRWRWPEAIRVVGDVQPRWFVFEQPTGIVSLDGRKPFLAIVGSLSALGYRVGFGGWPAGAVGAPHKRDRFFIIGCREDVGVAYAISLGNGWKPRFAEGHDSDGDSTRRAQADGRVDERSASRGVALGDPSGNLRGASRHDRYVAPHGAGAGGRAFGDGLADTARGRLCTWRGKSEGQQGRLDADERGASMGDACGELDNRKEPDWAGNMAQAPGSADCRRQDMFFRSVACPSSDRSDQGTHTQSALGRIIDGLSRGLAHLWPAGRGRQQYPWEPPRLVTRPPKGSTASLIVEAELEALGNACITQQCSPIFAAIAEIEREISAYMGNDIEEKERSRGEL